jgi:large subunit ribosomal protein L49
MGNLPVYSDTRAGGSKVVTILRKYQGDTDTLSQAVSQLCESDVEHFHGRLEVKGKHSHKLRSWLRGLGF